MNTNIVSYVNGLNRRTFTNNTQRALYTLITAAMEGTGWVSRGSVRVPSAAARLRDLRKEEFGGLDVVCQSSTQLGRTSGTRTTFYKLNTNRLSLSQIRRVFENV